MSKEARVECLYGFNLEDLGILLARGQVQWFDKATFDGSKSLKHAVQIGAVDVQWKSRAVAQKEAQPPWLRRRGRGPNRVVPPPKPSRAPAVNVDTIRTEAVAAATTAARSVVRELLAQDRQQRGVTPEQLEQALSKIMSPSGPPQADSPTMTELTRQLRQLVDKLQTRDVPAAPLPRPAEPEKDEDEPTEMFIPSGIVTSGKTDLNIEAEASTDDSLNAAAEALKKLAPKRRKAPKTTSGDE